MNRVNPLLRRLALVLAWWAPLPLAAPALADVYKWTDSQGQVHYADRPPNQAPAPAQRLGTGADPRREAEAEAARRALADKLSATKQKQQQEQEAQAKRQAALEDQARKDERCRKARDRVTLLAQGGRIARINAQGERYFLDDAQREAETIQAQREMEEICR